ncbi:MAG: hypothetical protein COA45_09390 [Zetaproteobacteria bacterium]|nr:MAG: hypothetical protein COA45_09390 [Zetaproteobacteria bacterium]
MVVDKKSKVNISQEVLVLSGAIVIASCAIGVSIFLGYAHYAQIVQEQAEDNNAFNALGRVTGKFLPKHCAQMAHNWGNTVIGGASSGIHVISPKNKGEPVSVSIEMIDPKQGVSYISADIRDVGVKGCSLIYDRTTHWSDTCKVVAQKRFSSYKPQRILRERISYLQKPSNKRMNLFMVPLSQGCLTIEKGFLSLKKEKPESALPTP